MTNIEKIFLFAVTLERPINKIHEKDNDIERSESQIKELDVQTNVIMKPNITSAVFARGLITNKNYYITVKGKRTWISYLSEVDNHDSAVVEYIIVFYNQAYKNLLRDALGGNSWGDLKWEIRPESFPNNSFSFMRNGVFQLCYDSKLKFLRDIIFKNSKPNKDLRFNKQKFLEVNSIVLEKLNEEQQNAVLNWMISTNFHIVEWDAKVVQIKIIIALLEVLRKTKLKVLITSSKNDSLDSLLVKASEQNVSFIRVANKASEVDTRIKDKVKIISSFKSYEEIDGIIKNENTVFDAVQSPCEFGRILIFEEKKSTKKFM